MHLLAALRQAVLYAGCAALMLLGCMPWVAKAASCADMQLLRLGSGVVTLPSGTVGQPYQYTLHATGGEPPYTYHAGSLPPGFTVSPAGELSGEPSPLPLITVFVAGVRDQHDCTAQQTYKLSIVAPWQPSPQPVPKPAPKPKPPEPPAPPPTPKEPPAPKSLTTLPLTDTLAAPFPSESAVDVYMLTADIFKDKDVLIELKQMTVDATPVDISANATDGKDDVGKDDTGKDDASNDDPAQQHPPVNDVDQPVDETIEADVNAQFQRLLKPLLDVEYPGEELFKAALDTRLCRFSADLITATANKNKLAAPVDEESGCPPKWDDLPEKVVNTPSNPLPWKELPQWLMSRAMRDLLIAKARRSHSLLQPPAPLWSGKGCGCVRQLSGETYGFYPYWHNADKPVPLDFSLISRINVFALWFRDNGDLVEPTWKAQQSTDFIREAHSHRTALDYTLYHNDWRFLKSATDDEITAMTQRLAVQAAKFIDTPLDDLASRSHAWVPGFAEVERYGNGLTLYLDKIPTDDDVRPAFKRYLDKQIRELIDELRRRDRRYVLNIVVRDEDLTAQGSVWQVERMTDYLRLAESVDPRGGNVASENARARSSTNLTLRYLVLLRQPTERGMRKVLSMIDGDKKIDEEECRILLHRVIPILSTGASAEPELFEDLAYASDNFGGAGFWAVPSLDEPAGKMTAGRIRASFLQRIPRAEQLNAWICEYRWPLRVAAEGLLLIWLVAFVIYQSSCRFRQVGLVYPLGLLLGAIAFLILGALLLVGDPRLSQLRQGNALLGLLLIVLIAIIGYHMLKPRVEKP
ncbi:hypothetical protein [Dyella silvae]|uniref:hypothetical protein n=1 Tax=Dyella silvae TaxID=2994424 RepID=UPI0022646914|nr:hypothetical protein [Dyella silvae]